MRDATDTSASRYSHRIRQLCSISCSTRTAAPTCEMVLQQIYQDRTTSERSQRCESRLKSSKRLIKHNLPFRDLQGYNVELRCRSFALCTCGSCRVISRGQSRWIAKLKPRVWSRSSPGPGTAPDDDDERNVPYTFQSST